MEHVVGSVPCTSCDGTGWCVRVVHQQGDRVLPCSMSRFDEVRKQLNNTPSHTLPKPARLPFLRLAFWLSTVDNVFEVPCAECGKTGWTLRLVQTGEPVRVTVTEACESHA